MNANEMMAEACLHAEVLTHVHLTAGRYRVRCTVERMSEDGKSELIGQAASTFRGAEAPLAGGTACRTTMVGNPYARG